MKILKYTKLKNNQYKINLDNGEEIKLYDDVILKENLLLTKEITSQQLTKIIASNDYYIAYYKALKLINTRLRSEKELRTLLKKTFTSNLIDKVIDTLKKEGYLDSKTYISSYIHDALILTLKGPNKIKKELLNMNFMEEKINALLPTDNNIWVERINKYLTKKLKISTNYSNQKLKIKMQQELLNLGYNKEMINEAISNLSFPSDKNNLIKDYQKIKAKLERKKIDNIDYQLISKLLQKGYNYEDIKDIMGSNY